MIIKWKNNYFLISSPWLVKMVLIIYLAVQYLPKDISQFDQFEPVQLTQVHRPEKVRRKARESNSKSWLVQFVC